MRALGPFGMLAATVAAASAFLVAYVAAGRYPSATALRLASLGVDLGLILWIAADARLRRRTPCYDFGFLVAVFFPFSLVWYVVWSRGLKGLLTLAGLFGLAFLPWVFAGLAWAFRS
jgi:hypothetical protein